MSEPGLHHFLAPVDSDDRARFGPRTQASRAGARDPRPTPRGRGRLPPPAAPRPGPCLRWIEAKPTDGTETEHPAPTPTLAPAQEDATSVPADATWTDDDDSAKTIGFIALGVGAIGVVLGAVAFARRRPASS